MLPLERARKTVAENVAENGLVCYVWMCGSRDMEVWISWKTADSAISAISPDIQTPISREPHIQT